MKQGSGSGGIFFNVVKRTWAAASATYGSELIATEYGKVTRSYHGNGSVKFANGDEFPCRVYVEQVENGLILLSCFFSSGIEIITKDRGLQHIQIDSVHGQVEDGLKFETRNEILVRGWGYSSTESSCRLLVALVAQEVTLWKEVETCASHYKFSVANFEFTGNYPTSRIIASEDTQLEYGSSCLELKTPWGIVIVDTVLDYDDVLRMIKVQKGISITCNVIVKASQGLELPEVIMKLNELCRLLSLARGTKINWINAEAYTEDGHIRQIVLRNSIMRPFSFFPLIDPYNPEDTPLFIEKVYPTYLTLRDSYNLDVAIEQLLDAKRETVYLATRALAAVAMLDSLQQQFASCHGFDQIMKGFGGKKLTEFRCCLKELITSSFPGANPENLKEILGKTPELNRRSFLKLLKMWMCELELKIPDRELSAVRNTRHALAHSGRFTSTDQHDKLREYYRIINVINQAFLKLLNYDGYFVHVDHVDLDKLRFDRRKLD